MTTQDPAVAFSAARRLAEQIWRTHTHPTVDPDLHRDLDAGPWCLLSVPVDDATAARVLDAMHAAGVDYVEVQLREAGTVLWFDLDPDRRSRSRSRLASALDHLVDPTPEELAALEHYRETGGPTDDYAIVARDWGAHSNDEIDAAYGRVSVSASTGRRYMCLGHGEALTRTEIAPASGWEDRAVERARTDIRRDYPIAYALVSTSEDCPLTRYAHGLWPAGIVGCGHGDGPPLVVAVVIDSGAGRDEHGIRAALKVTYLDESYRITIDDAVSHLVDSEIETLAIDRAPS